MKYLQNEARKQKSIKEVTLQFSMIFQIRLKNNTVNFRVICPLIDKFARFRHETIVKMENMSREEKIKAMKLPELKANLQNRGITVNSLPQTRTPSYCLCRRRNEFFISFSSQ